VFAKYKLLCAIFVGTHVFLKGCTPPPLTTPFTPCVPVPPVFSSADTDVEKCLELEDVARSLVAVAVAVVVLVVPGVGWFRRWVWLLKYPAID